MSVPLITIAVPSYNQGRYLDEALRSLFQQECSVEVFVLDAGSTDNSLEVIRKWAPRLSGWRSYPDRGQAAAINEGIACGQAPYVGWLNSDDWLLPGSLSHLVSALENNLGAPMAYGRAWNFTERSQTMSEIWVEPFNEHRLAFRCIISQPATLIRRSAWEAAGGLNENLDMALDYDLWWRLFRLCGTPEYIQEHLAVNRDHGATKSRTRRREHYREAISTVRRHYGRVPLKWWVAQPYTVWLRSLIP